MELDYWRQKCGVQDQKLDDLATSQIEANYALSCLPYELHISSSILYSVGKLLSKSSRLPRTEATGPETYRPNLTCTRIPPPSPNLTKSRASPLPCAASLPCAALRCLSPVRRRLSYPRLSSSHSRAGRKVIDAPCTDSICPALGWVGVSYFSLR
jgi:hypothetical protein